MSLSKFQYPMMICIGYVILNVLEAVYSVTGYLALAIGVACMMMPGIPKFLRPIGLGMVLASDVVQGFVTTITDKVIEYLRPADEDTV